MQSNLLLIINSNYKSHFSTGNGVVIHIPQFFDELEALEAKGNSCSQAFLLACSVHVNQKAAT